MESCRALAVVLAVVLGVRRVSDEMGVKEGPLKGEGPDRVEPGWGDAIWVDLPARGVTVDNAAEDDEDEEDEENEEDEEEEEVALALAALLADKGNVREILGEEGGKGDLD